MRKLLTIFGLFALISCSQVIEIDFPEFDHVWTLNGVIVAGDEYPDTMGYGPMFPYVEDIRFYVGKTLPPNSFGLIEAQWDEEGTLEIYREEQLVDVVQSDGGNPFQPFYRPSHLFAPGTSYEVRMNLSDPNQEQLVAKQTIPQKVDVYNVNIQSTSSQDVVRFTFQDPPGSQVYCFRIIQYNSSEFGRSYGQSTFQIMDPTFGWYREEFDFGTGQQNLQEAFVRDDFFDQTEKTLEIRINKSREEAEAYIIEMVSITQEMHRYLESLFRNRDAQGNPFAEPVVLNFNVENGLGAVVAATRTLIVVPL